MFSRPVIRKGVLWAIMLLAVFGLAYVAVIYPLLPGLNQETLEAGQVASQDYISPRTISFISDVLTSNRKAEAEALVVPQFSSQETSVARAQVGRLRDALAFVTAVRGDQFATIDQKLADLAALDDVQLSQETAQSILTLSDARWQTAQQETVSVLEQVMRNAIREDRLEEARRSVPTRVSLSLPEDQAVIVNEIAAAFVAPNSFFSAELTEAARLQARDAIQPITRTLLAGETIVQRGRVIGSSDLEALGVAGLIEGGDTTNLQAAGLAIVFVTAAFSVLYLRRRPNLTDDIRSLTLLSLLFLAFLVSARFILPNHSVLPYIFPLSAFSLTISTLFGTQPGLISILPMAVLVTFGLPNALELSLYYIFSATFGVFTLGFGQRIWAFLRASIAIAFAGIVVMLAYRLADGTTDMMGLLTLGSASLFNGAVSAGLTVVLQFFLAQFLGKTTALQLLELSRPDHPLLQYILRRAPGTYQHSLQVANLAEQAAERLNADALLVRVGALYHDSGKANNPSYFIENQLNSTINPHDQLTPEKSAAMIIQHVTDGIELARKHRLPRRIQDFILEHHGDSITRYQYVRAVEAAGNDESLVDSTKFRYPGPRPRSRETAILMLADSAEAVTRAKVPQSEEELRQMIAQMVEHRRAEGLLDETNLTFHDIREMIDSFTATLKGVYHPRIEYPHLNAQNQPHEVAALPANLPVEAMQALPSTEPETRPIDSLRVPTISAPTSSETKP